MLFTFREEFQALCLTRVCLCVYLPGLAHNTVRSVYSLLLWTTLIGPFTILIWQLDGVFLLILIKSALLFSFDQILWQILDDSYKFANIRKNVGNFYSSPSES